VLPTLNHVGANERRDVEDALYARGDVDHIYRKWLEEMDRRDGSGSGLERRGAGNLTLGYVTQDACPGVGDDTLHAPLAYYDVPDFIASIPPQVANDAPIDLVFVDFIANQLLQILNSVQSAKMYTTADIQTYSPVLANAVLGVYAEHAWS